MDHTTRIELAEGAWVNVKTRTNLGDLEYIESVKLREYGGKSTPTLDAILMLDRIITEWSFDDPVTPEAIRERLDMSALQMISSGVVEVRNPNGSRPSSPGGRRRAKSENDPSNG